MSYVRNTSAKSFGWPKKFPHMTVCVTIRHHSIGHWAKSSGFAWHIRRQRDLIDAKSSLGPWHKAYLLDTWAWHEATPDELTQCSEEKVSISYRGIFSWPFWQKEYKLRCNDNIVIIICYWRQKGKQTNT